MKTRNLLSGVLLFAISFCFTLIHQTSQAQPCQANTDWGGTTLTGINEVLTISTGNLIGDYSEVLNAVDGDQYTFVSTDNSGTDPIYITVRSGTFNGPVIGSGFSPLTVIGDINGAIFPNYSADELCDFSSIGGFTSTVQCISCPVFCDDLGVLEGTPCDDGDPDTNFDRINSDCECAGNLPCLANTDWQGTTLTGINEVLTISTGNLIGDYSEVLNAVTGDQYTFVSTDNSGTDPIYITVRGGTFDGPVIGSGFSPLTVTSDADGAIYPHYSANQFCEFTSIGSFTSTVQCISCPVYCPVLDMLEGDPCNDGNPLTNYDMITADCLCAGNLPCLANTDWQGTTLTGINEVLTISTGNLIGDYSEVLNAVTGDQYTFVSTDNSGTDPIYITVRGGTFDGPVIGSGFSPLTVTSDVDGAIYPHYSANQFCEFTSIGSFTSTVQCISCPVFCPDLGVLEGTPCDDGDPDTNFDMITADCECAGNLPCLGGTFWSSVDLPGTNEVIEMSTSNLIGDYNEALNATAGDQYTFTSIDNFGTDAVYITVRGGAFDGPVIGSGYSPLTITSDVDGAIYAHYSANEFCEFTAIGSFTSTVQCISCPVYCPDLDLIVGSPCDDGNPDTDNDAVTSECECFGEQPCLTPAQWSIRTFDGTNIVVLGSTCNLEDEYNAFENAESGSEYTFTSTDDGSPGFITIRSGIADGPVLGFGFSPVTVVSDIDGTLFAHYTENGNCDFAFGCVQTGAQCISCPVYCPDLDMVEGDPCNDGDPDTNFDMITADCECAGNLPCLAGTDWQGATLTGTNQILSISTGNLMGDYSEVLNAVAGDQYTFVSTDNSGTDPIYITVRSGTFDGLVIGSGYSPLTVTSDIDGALYPHYSANEFCDFTSIGSFTSTVQCITCPVYCPELDLAVGDACDDGNPDTNFDMVNAECECAGNLPCIGDFQWLTINMTGTDDVINISTCNLTSDFNIINNVFDGDQYSFTGIDGDGTEPVYITVRSGAVDGPVLGSGYSPLTITSDIDGAVYVTYSKDEFCDFTTIGCIITTVQCTTCDYDCPSIGADIGDACDDGNPGTTGEVINDLCECAVPTLATISGTVNWNSNCGDRELAIGFFQTGTDNLLAVVEGFLNADGTYSLTGFPTGTFDVYAVLEGHLSKGYPNQTISAGVNTANLGSFIAGDINGSNGVNISDFSLLNVAFGSSDGDSNYNYLADFNCDGNVNIFDVSILNIGFGMVGETP